MVMEANTLETLIQLIVVLVVAVGAVGVLLHLGSRTPTRQHGFLIGYPPDLYPAHDLTSSGSLAALAETQRRLVSMYRQLPVQSDLTIWLRTFLGELREIMDTTYRVTVIMQIYGKPVEIDRLVAEVQQIEVQVAEHVTKQLLSHDADAHNELLNGRLATLRMCARELAYSSNHAAIPAMPATPPRTPKR
jgi:hypothetical protein